MVFVCARLHVCVHMLHVCEKISGLKVGVRVPTCLWGEDRKTIATREERRIEEERWQILRSFGLCVKCSAVL